MFKPKKYLKASLAFVIGSCLVVACGSGDSTNFAKAGPKNILFVGNSYTFARIAPALQYNSQNVKDLTAAFNAIDATGTNSLPVGSGVAPNPCATPGTGCFEPHNWGGLPGIFKKFTDQAGLNYTVSLSTRNAATLRGQYLNTANANWNMLGNIASSKWDTVVLQAQSDEPLPANMSKNGNYVSFSTYANLLERYIHVGTGTTTTETSIFGSLSACTAATTANPPGPGLSAASCGTTRTIPTNTNANPNAKVYLFASWARPDMVAPHKCTTPDLTTTDGAPMVDPTCSNGSNGSATTGMNTIYYTSLGNDAANLGAMNTDLKKSFQSLVTKNPGFTDLVPIGDAFQRAVDNNWVKNNNFYKADGTFDDSGKINLWFKDRTHESVYGAYLSGLMLFSKITGVTPLLGYNDQVYKDLGIASADALMLQQVAFDTLVANGWQP